MTDDARAPADDEIRLLAEAVADVLEERGLVGSSTAASRVLDAGEVAAMLGRDRRWVYEHAVDLGAFRFGDGPRARLGFDSAGIERWKRARKEAGSPTRPVRPRRQSRRSRRGGANLIPFDAS